MEAKMDGLKKGMEAKMDSSKKYVENKMDRLKKHMEDKMYGLKYGIESKIDSIEEKLKVDMEGFKEGLTKLLQEMIPNGGRVVDETHDENKRNVNNDFIDSIVVFKTHHIPNIYMNNFDGKDTITRILQIEQYY